MNGYKNRTHTYAVYKRPRSDLGTRTDWKWGDKGDIPCKSKSKEKWSSTSDKIDFQTKNVMRQRRTLPSDQRINPRRGYNKCKYICTQQGVPQYLGELLTVIKGEIDHSKVTVGDINTQLKSYISWFYPVCSAPDSLPFW